MKTPEQIKAWLEAQPWYEQFKLNVLNSKYPEYQKQLTLNGERGIHTIAVAFMWAYTPEGFFFWLDVYGTFTEWYDDENPD